MFEKDIFDKKWMFDIDDSLLRFMPAFLKFFNSRNFDINKRDFRHEDIYTYDLWKVFNMGKTQSVNEVLEFYKTRECHELIEVDGAGDLLKRLNVKPVAITARPSKTRTMSEYNLSLRFEEYAPKVLFSRPYTHLLGESSEGKYTKAELCSMEKVEYALEDSSYHANNLAESGINVFLLDQPWNPPIELNPRIRKIKSLREILMT